MKYKKSRDKNMDKDIQKVNKYYEEKEKRVKQIIKEQKKINLERGIVIFLTTIGLFGLMFLALFLISLIPISHIVRLAIYLFVILPIFGYLILLVNKYIKFN